MALADHPLQLGGATAAIGDPSGRTTSREAIDTNSRRANMASMHVQMKRLWQKMEKHADRRGYEWEWAWRRHLFNNNEWLQKVSIYEFLSKLGTGMRVGPLLGRDT
jgi:tyrosyl-tRNA synthetase